ncbi:MAG: hypothetical protein ABSA83_00530 [Verrucomicrobiota bacterium]
MNTLVGAYQKTRDSNPKWDESAKRALTEFARSRARCTASNEDWQLIISNGCAAAVNAGCKDPMVRYLYIRLCLGPTLDKQGLASALCDNAVEFEKSSYPGIRKFYAWLRAGQQIIRAYGYGTNIPPELDRLGSWRQAESHLLRALRDPAMPPEEAHDACHEYLNEWLGDTNYYPVLYHKMETQFAGDRTNAPALLLLKGETYAQMAWQARGCGYADTVTKEGWKLFSQRLDAAEEALTNAWQLDTNNACIAAQMITVELGQGRGRDRMELWFKRAMDLDPNNYDACDGKLRYLLPRWYGSVSDTLQFGHECVQNKRWGGHVPLILVDAHNFLRETLPDEEKTNYWERPEVWADVKDAFDRFFELNPRETSWYHNYAKYAWQAEQWGFLNALIPKLGPVNYAYFGGKEKFEKMVALAKEHASQAKTKE